MFVEPNEERNIYHPKTLLYTSSTFNNLTGTGILLCNLFRGWSRDRIAHIYNDNFPYDPQFCQSTYKLGSAENHWVWPLSSLATGRQQDAGSPSRVPSRPAGPAPRHGWQKRARPAFEGLLRMLGGQDILHRLEISAGLRQWARAFKPEIIYSHISSLNSIRFSRALRELLGCPLCIHIMDDWLTANYRTGLFAPRLRKQYLSEFQDLVNAASLRLGIGQKMCDEYAARYGRPFVPFSNAIDTEQWLRHARPAPQSKHGFRLVYAGTINTKNINNLKQTARLAADLAEEGKALSLEIYTFSPRDEQYRRQLEVAANVRVGTVPEQDADMAALLGGADLLLLPVDFTEVSVERMRYSVFAKVPAYMISGAPILLWGPGEIATTEYAKREDWALVVEQDDPALLREALLRLMEDRDLRKRLSTRARELAKAHFDGPMTRARFRLALAQAAQGQEVTAGGGGQAGSIP